MYVLGPITNIFMAGIWVSACMLPALASRKLSSPDSSNYSSTLYTGETEGNYIISHTGVSVIQSSDLGASQLKV